MEDSAFSGALVRIPSGDITDLEPDWEIDPAGLIIMDKLGECLLSAATYKSSDRRFNNLFMCLYCTHTTGDRLHLTVTEHTRANLFPRWFQRRLVTSAAWLYKRSNSSVVGQQAL